MVTPLRLLARALVLGPLAARPGQAAGLAGAIAVGVAMVAAIHWINASALHSFEQGVQALSGGADTAVVPTSGHLGESLLTRLRAHEAVAAAYPALRMTVPVDAEQTLPVLGVDLLREGEVRGDYLPELGGEGLGLPDLLGRGSVLLGRDAARALDVAPGGTVTVQQGVEPVRLRVVGLLPPEAFWSDGAVMDISTAQWTFARVGELDRIDVRLTAADARAELAAALPEGVRLSRPGLEAQRLDAMTRAYRVNLNVLALVGLLTAGFLVYSLLSLAMRRRRPQLNLLRVLGMERRRLAGWLLGEGAVLGLIGGPLGVAIGLGLAWLGVMTLGGDLGAGYFQDIGVRLVAHAPAMIGFALLGVAAGIGGTLAPVLANVRGGEAGLRRGAAEGGQGLSVRVRLAGAVLAAAAAAVLAGLPAWQGLPVAGYGAILLVLAAGLLAAPPVLGAFARLLPRLSGRPVWLVARAQLLGAPRRTALAAGAVLVSFALLVAMSTMVHSFRGSVAAWLDQILAADVYVRSGPDGASTYIPAEDWRAVADWEAVHRLEPFRRLDVDWAPAGSNAPAEAPVRVTVRQLDWAEARAAVTVLRGAWPSGPEEVLVSEVMARRHGVGPGDTLRLPIGGARRTVTVAGVWRDYSYQWGHVLLDRRAWTDWSEDRRADQLAVYLRDGADPRAVRERLQQTFADAHALEIADAREIRRHSLAVFDRSFAVTYVLVVVAVAVGLVGTLQALAVQGLERRGEMAMLRFLGFRVRDVAAGQALEAGLTGAFGGLLGLGVGGVVAVLLVKVVNDQSFLWALPVDFPVGLLAGAWLVLVAATAAGGWVLGRRQGRQDPTRAVAEE